jgi:hypothetical protein
MFFNFTYILPDPDELGFFPLDEDSSLDFDFLAKHKMSLCIFLIANPFV